MRDIFRNSALFFILTAVIAATGIRWALAQSTTATSTATIIKPVQLDDRMVNMTLASFRSDVTGDLVIRIAAAIAAALEDQGIEQADFGQQEKLIIDCARLGGGPEGCGAAPEAGVLDGNPVNSITVGTFDASRLNPVSIDVIIAYN